MGIRKLVPGADPTRALNDIYSYGRTFPRGKAPAAPTKANRDLPKHTGGDGLELDARCNSPAIQSREDARAPGYANDVPMDWRRGKGLPPHFDAGPSGRRYSGKR